MDTSLSDDSCLEHLLHCEQLVSLLLLNLPHLSEASTADNIFELKITLANLYRIYLLDSEPIIKK